MPTKDEFERLKDLAGALHVVMKEADTLEMLFTALATELDEWSIEHGVSTTALEEMMDRTASVMKDAHKVMGW